MHRLRKRLALSVFITVTAMPGVHAKEASELYENYCAACHNLGVAGAPRITDPDAWKSRIAQGNKVLYENAINGFIGESGSMPPKGGFVDLSNEQIKIIVEYIVSRVR